MPKPEALEAIVAFVTSEELDLLSKQELEEYVPGFQAPMRLQEFLTQDCDLEASYFSISLAGPASVP